MFRKIFTGIATPENGQASVSFSPPTSDGGAPITSYKLTCAPGTITATGTSSPLTVTGLSAGVTYSCSVTASNSAGEGPASSAVNVMPLSTAAPVTLAAVVSRKTHGSAGSFDLTLDSTIGLSGAVSTEPRTIGAGHQIVFRFTGPVTQAGVVSAIDSAGAAIGIVSAIVNPVMTSEVIVTLTGIAENQRLTVSLTGVNGTVNTSVSIGFLVGDINNSRSVNSSDISSVKARSGQTTDASNFVFDLNASGTVNASDILAVKARSGSVLAP